jgi:hypothetical protein
VRLFVPFVVSDKEIDGNDYGSARTFRALVVNS